MSERTPASIPRPRNAPLLVLLIAGSILLIGGLGATVFDRVLTPNIEQLGGSARLQSLPSAAYAGYHYPPVNTVLADYRLLPVCMGVAAVGVVLLIAAAVLRATKPRNDQAGIEPGASLSR